MAIYKPSNFYPNLEEIDLDENNTFSCQINTSGNSVKAYQLKFLTEDNVEVAKKSAVDLASYVKNKAFLNIDNINSTNYSGLTNGNNYKWTIRVYDAPLNSTSQPDTLICSGFLVGSTENVIWTTNNKKIEAERWIEFKTTSSQMMPLLETETDLTLPTGTYTERHKIDWVTTDLGNDKNITKIETDEPFVYNYINNTTFNLYQCSDKHGYNNVFVDPNDEIEVGMGIDIFNGGSSINSNNVSKIIGYSTDTGEIRVQEPFKSIPVNGYTYKLYKKNDSGLWQQISFTEPSNLIGGAAITDSSFKVMTNYYSSSTKNLFIQPNINIKSDATNPNEIVFNDGTRVDIVQNINSSGKDITFNKLDNTQWIVTIPSSTSSFPVIPKTKYKIYSDFMDSMPENIFYAKKSPTIQIQYKNYNIDEEEYVNISETPTEYKSFRDISFKTLWTSAQNVLIKNYQYLLYDVNMNLISESDIIYDNELEWHFRGLDTSRNENIPNQYFIKIIIEDEFGKIFEKQNTFYIFYNINETITPLVVNLNCDQTSFDIEFTTPIYVETSNALNKETVEVENVDFRNGYLNIPLDNVANYSKVVAEEELYVDIPEEFSYITCFQLSKDLIYSIPSSNDNSILLLQIGHKNNLNTIDYYSLKLGSFEKLYFYEQDGIITVKENPNQFKLQLFKNEETEPLQCFEGENYYDLSEQVEGKDLIKSSKINFALQDNSENIYEKVSILPNIGESGKKYILTENYTIGITNYSKGIYTYTNSKWIKDLSVEYIFIDSLNTTPSLSFDDLNVPANCRGRDNATINYIDTNNVFIESSNIDYNAETISNKWIRVYLYIKNSNTGNIVECSIDLLKERG